MIYGKTEEEWIRRIAAILYIFCYPHPVTLLLAELSVICELAIHLVSPTTVRACGSRPTSLTVIIRWWDDFSTRTASSCGMPRKLRPFTSRIWSPTCKNDRGERGEGGWSDAGRAGQRGKRDGDGGGVVWITGQISVQWYNGVKFRKNRNDFG